MLNVLEKGFRLESGRLCLDFANTADWHASAHPVEELNSYKDLLDWASKVGLLDDSQARVFHLEAARRPGQAKAALEKAVELREAIYRTFSARAHGLPPAPETLEIINRIIAEAFPLLQVAAQGIIFQWIWTGVEGRLDWFLGPVALSAAELLTSEEIIRVGECADDRGCGWLFYDNSRNRSRRWCDMKDCGNRAKARRHYRRVKRI